MSLMKALVCVEPGRFEQQDRPRPEAKPGHIRIRILQVGICGTDYHIYGGHQPFLAYPRIMGHELSGRAMEASADGRIAEGDLVVINPYLTCGTCRACRAGKPNCCENIAVLGVHTDGGMCEEIVVPEGNVYGAEGLTEQSAAMVEFLAIGAHGVRRGGVRAGSAALVVGAGPIGIGAALFAAIEGGRGHAARHLRPRGLLWRRRCCLRPGSSLWAKRRPRSMTPSSTRPATSGR